MNQEHITSPKVIKEQTIEIQQQDNLELPTQQIIIKDLANNKIKSSTIEAKEQIKKDQKYFYVSSPGEDEEFEENDNSEDMDNLKRKTHLTNKLNTEESFHSQDKKVHSFIQNEIKSDNVYNIVVKEFPPNPLLPKSFQFHCDSPKSGGPYAFLKLIKFRGKDFGKSKLSENDKEVEQIEFPERITLKSIFLPINKNIDTDQDHQSNMTQVGELIYLRSVLDFSSKSKSQSDKKDEVLEENLLDVKRLLKTSQAANQGGSVPAINQQSNSKQQSSKKALMHLVGVEPYYTKKDLTDKTLIFESRFESGNLAAALKVDDNDYHLLLQNDVNTSGHTQWFFFRVQNTSQYHEVRFNILNLSKPDSIFNEGMKVLVYSERLQQEKDIGWQRGCSKILYYQNGIRKENEGKKFKSYYTLTFSYEFTYSDDTVFFAYCYPYTYTDLIGELNKIQADPIKSQFCSRKTLCETLAGNKCEMLTITSKQNLENLAKRKGVVITARAHPGESVGSWMMKGAIDFLTDDQNEEAELLRQNFVFKIIPMLNPDGVINGNYRCSLAGCDLNRRWKTPNKFLHSTVFNTKQMIINFAKERELTVFCDFHGHSRRKNIFMYGCQIPGAPEETRLYPFILSKLCPFFSYGYSRFSCHKSKEATARIAMFNELKIPAIYTMESSFCGNNIGPYSNYHFSTDNLMQTGRDFCRTLFIFQATPQIPTQITNKIVTNILELYEYYKNQNDLKDLLSKDQDTEAMKIFLDKLRQWKEDKIEITCKGLKKVFLQVFRQTQDIYEGYAATSSSAGSDKAPSDDNLEPEDIIKVLPDDLLDEKAKNLKKKKEQLIAQQSQVLNINQQQQQLQSESQKAQQFRKKTLVDNQLNKQNLGNTSKQFKRMSFVRAGDAQKQDKGISSNKNTLDLEIIKMESNQTDQQEDLKVGTEETDTSQQKKKKKRIVDSKDASTQTYRSDYMLIKLRQQQKQSSNHKGQKIDEVPIYDSQQYLNIQANKQLLNCTQDIPTNTQNNNVLNLTLNQYIKIQSSPNPQNNSSFINNKQSKVPQNVNTTNYSNQLYAQNSYTNNKNQRARMQSINTVIIILFIGKNKV